VPEVTVQVIDGDWVLELLARVDPEWLIIHVASGDVPYESYGITVTARNGIINVEGADVLGVYFLSTDCRLIGHDLWECSDVLGLKFYIIDINGPSAVLNEPIRLRPRPKPKPTQ